MDRQIACLIFVFLFLGSMVEVVAQTKTIQPTDAFDIPAVNGRIQFATNLSYATADLQNDTWYFTGLKASVKSGPINGHLHFSAVNCTVLVTYLQAWTQPESHYSEMGMIWIKYTVTEGAGTQVLNTNDLFPNSVKWTAWNVIINGEKQPMGKLWNYSENKKIIISTLPPQSKVVIYVIHVPVGSEAAPLPPPETALENFTAADCFSIPSTNGTVKFAVDGSFDKASLNNDTWNFANLTLSTYAINAGIFAPNITGRDVLPYIQQGGHTADLGVSANNCNLTINGIAPLTWHSYIPEINYTVIGNGSQTFTFPFKLSAFNWTVYSDGAAEPMENGWFLKGEYQIEVTNAGGNVSIIGISLPQSMLAKPPFYINFALVVAATVTIFVLVALIVRRRKRANAAAATLNQVPIESIKKRLGCTQFFC